MYAIAIIIAIKIQRCSAACKTETRLFRILGKSITGVHILGRRRFAPKRYKRSHPRRRNFQQEERPRKRGRELEDEIRGLIYSRPEGLSFNDIMSSLGLNRRSHKEIKTLLTDLTHRKLLNREGDFFKSRRTADLAEGTIAVHPRGYAFVTVSKAPAGMKIDQDLFVRPDALGTATHGDRVLLKITGSSRGRLEGQVVRVLERAASEIVGIYSDGWDSGLVRPEDERYPFDIVIRKEHKGGAKDGDAVVAKISRYLPEQRSAEGRIIEVLGNPDDLQVQTDITIRKFNLPHQFSEEVHQQVQQISADISLEPGRADLRDIFHVTIDGENARDFDDAVSVQKTRNGFRLYVSIADVSHYVTQATALDVEAYERGTSVYFPTRVVPMLPERLSNDLCSLKPNEDRLAFSAILDFDRQGNRKKKEFTKSIIRSQHRLTYTIVKEILIDKNKERRGQYNPILTQLKWMNELAIELERKRMARGSIGFELPEAEVILGADDKIIRIDRLERNQAHKIIEEFMLAANEAVAEALDELNIDTLYRIHETPDPVKVAEFTEFAKCMGLDIPEGSGSPAWFGKVLKIVADTPREYIVNNLLLRTMKQARYSPNNVGHFGLAASHYTHFTSPIRRYPDLMVHRAFSGFLHGKKMKKTKEVPSKISTLEAGDFLSKRERVAVDAEREMVDRLKVRFMADKVGEVYDAVVAGVTSFGIFVELIDFFVSGAVLMTDLKDDYYDLDEQHHRLIGRGTNKTYQIGDLVQVKLKSVDIQRRHINFLLK